MANWKVFFKTDWWLRSSSRGDYDYFRTEGGDICKNTGYVYKDNVMTGLCSSVLDFPLACMI